MHPHRQPRPPFTDVSPEVLEKAFHPFDKLVIGLPPSMMNWTRVYGPAADWISLPPNPLMPSFRRRHEGSDAPSAVAAAGSPSSDPRGRAGEGPDARPTGRPFRCEACDRTFVVEEKYEEHMQTHIYCTMPGCGFTCRAHRAHQMQEHMDALHNRPDAPNLADTGAYLEQRKNRFPTQEVIKGKVEELYYKAARGVVLPDERRRWLRQYGIDVGKRARTEASYIARGSLPENSRSPSAQSNASDAASDKSSRSSGSRRSKGGGCGRDRDEERHHSSPVSCPPLPPESRKEEVARPRFIQPPSQALEDPTAPPSAPSAAPEQPSLASPPTRPSSLSSSKQPSKIIPLGPNGTLTPRQRVQLVRERYASAKEVPQFYVCHRCGKKGEHWVDDCPTKGDPTYNRRVLWGETKIGAGEGKSKAAEKRERSGRSRNARREEEEHGEQRPAEQGEDNTVADAGPLRGSAPPANSAVEGEAPEADPRSCHIDNSGGNGRSDSERDDGPPVPQSAAPPADEPKEITRVMAPVAAARYANPNRRDPLRRPPPPPTLYERLTEEERLNEQGVLLQAMRFFTARDFFQEKI
ncbi:hypothetical protein ABL78_2152 [Leptomonas seymouri]|uniref:C2H2-type domain-containing protein n=1 Tax=Leptomonas seymouri TaxID=5684 RepID=A0A0N1I7Y7_LEPSE|nr:hypothetical protein ABL78_2152 [Leptomonas seymouri]|eukprot:KPI88773.1 hypothetical protein ABL78_2152 [Leptomonas seymouri]